VTFGGFLLGPFVALRVGMAAAPESEVLQIAAVLGFASIFAGGAVIWLGLGIAAAAVGFVWSLVRGRRPGPADLGSQDRLVPPGYGAFVALGLLVGAAVGVLAALTTEAGLFGAVGAWAALGLGYGLLLWGAARSGYLPFEPE